MNVTFNKLYIFDTMAETAYTTEFKKGINIITSSDIDGTDRGKSVLLRSLYHSLGADSHFDAKWNECDKVYILKFSVDNTEYYIYRSQRLFKIFNSNLEIIFMTIHRSELALFLGELFDFTIYLPNKNTKELEIAPPAYSFLFNFLDQDHYEGTKFSSFKNLAQFSNFKLNVIYSHLGIYDKNYFECVKRKEELENEIKAKKEDIDSLIKMKDKTIFLLDGFSCPETTEALENELEIETKKYSELMNEMNSIRNKLIELRNELEEQSITLNQISKFENRKEKEITLMLKSKVCPECYTVLDNTIELRSKRYNQIDNTISFKDGIRIENARIKEEIKNYENQYSKLEIELKNHNDKIYKNRKEIKDYIRFSGLNKLIDEINTDLLEDERLVGNIKEELKPIKKELKSVNQRIKSADELYYSLIDKLKIQFNLNELQSTDYEQMSKNFCASGSNKPLSTVIWYMTLNGMKGSYNLSGIQFPMVFDSPNNAETDQEKKHSLVQYIMDSSSKFNQLIVSAIGFSESSYKLKNKVNIKTLDNKKYGLLNEEVYKENYGILLKMNNA
ncbi:cytoplasmic protein [Helcococcus ovis]|uniref:cytoplasmic protein n=1 Tax=Helcococcus ovis TaxID=72026 RepID=UPI00106F3774|nr:cytoplasmic protein [Helcococcus ovis]TFF65023.1 cytoplasmic protein [Helcococcus ovis]